ncbi:MAG TPA: NAD(P)-dependent oxidoreductase [Vicinamibacterales bacterium]|nr:NAD(P)-dependent oxidoreductase [Vicinamibacterales bacterium]
MKLLILSPIDPGAAECLGRNHHVVDASGAPPDALPSLVADRDVLIFRSGVNITADLMRCAPRLTTLIRGGSGFDNVDLDYVSRHGLAFIRVPQPGARAVAELAFGLMLALARNIVRADGLWRQGRWVKHEMTGYTLRGKTLGIVGVGNIGTVVGELGVAWGMRVIGCHDTPTAAVTAALREKGIGLAPLDEVVSRADFLTLHVPLTARTRHLVNASVLARMKRGSFLLNLARGGVVDEAALRAELLSGERLLGAALDVHEAEGEGRVSPLADLPNVVLTPHIGASAFDTQREIGERIVSIVESLAASPARAALEQPGPSPAPFAESPRLPIPGAQGARP